MSNGLECPGRIEPGDLYARVRMGSWLEYEPVRIECLAAAGIIELLDMATT